MLLLCFVFPLPPIRCLRSCLPAPLSAFSDPISLFYPCPPFTLNLESNVSLSFCPFFFFNPQTRKQCSIVWGSILCRKDYTRFRGKFGNASALRIKRSGLKGHQSKIPVCRMNCLVLVVVFLVEKAIFSRDDLSLVNIWNRFRFLHKTNIQWKQHLLNAPYLMF